MQALSASRVVIPGEKGISRRVYHDRCPLAPATPLEANLTIGTMCENGPLPSDYTFTEQSSRTLPAPPPLGSEMLKGYNP